MYPFKTQCDFLFMVISICRRPKITLLLGPQHNSVENVDILLKNIPKGDKYHFYTYNYVLCFCLFYGITNILHFS